MDPDTAAEALGILRDGKHQVRRAARREQWLTRGVHAVTNVLWLARKDIRDPGRRRAASAGLVLVMAGSGFWEFKRSNVGTLWQERIIDPQPDSDGDSEPRHPGWFADDLSWPERLRAMFSALTPAGKRLVVASAAAAVAQPLVVLAFRRSGIRYPNLAAGVATAAMSTAIGLMRDRPEAADE